MLDAIKGVLPILHSNSGFSLNARFSANAFNGAVGRHFRGPQETSATNLYDKLVVFGGTSRLLEQTKNTVKVLNGEPLAAALQLSAVVHDGRYASATRSARDPCSLFALSLHEIGAPGERSPFPALINLNKY